MIAPDSWPPQPCGCPSRADGSPPVLHLPRPCFLTDPHRPHAYSSGFSGTPGVVVSHICPGVAEPECGRRQDGVLLCRPSRGCGDCPLSGLD